VEELAELLVVEFDDAEGTPKLNPTGGGRIQRKHFRPHALV
jgi:hypothetical protein